MDTKRQLYRPHAARWHAGDSVRVGSLVLAAVLGFHSGRASAASGNRAGAELPVLPGATAAAPVVGAHENPEARAGLEREAASADVRYVAAWVAKTRDNQAQPYIIIDKADARVYIFDAAGRLQGTSPALLGMVKGDGSADGLGNRALSAIAPQDRTTPAGRFQASLGRDLKGQDILWVDYGTSLALHRVVKGTSAERRAERLQSRDVLDNRISYGCINVPAPFYEGYVRPAFTHSSGMVYILPEMSRASDMFKHVDDEPRAEPMGSGL